MSEKSDFCGWHSDLRTFCEAAPKAIVDRLNLFVRDAGEEQYRAWKSHIPTLQRECKELTARDALAARYSAILEYQLPYDLRRADVIVLERAAVVVAELKGYQGGLTEGTIDQVLGYVRDLRAYHALCAERPVIPVLVTAAASRPPLVRSGVHICHPIDFDVVMAEIATASPGDPVAPNDFVAPGTYVPLPTIVQAARQLFETRELPYIKRARAATEPALEHITDIAHQAAKNGTRHLVLLSGVPGSGKTLVGLQLVHARWLDDLAESRSGAKPTAAGVYLSGNGPLVQVLQDALRDGGAAGQTFVRPIKAYVEFYSKRRGAIPPEHLIVFDEAQRAHDAERVAHVHGTAPDLAEPDHLLRFCERIPRWNVLVALIGTGQAIHVGEEGGVPLWRKAVDALPTARQWSVHCPAGMSEHFAGTRASLEVSQHLNLDVELRYHQASDVHEYVGGLLADADSGHLEEIAKRLAGNDFRVLVTRDLNAAKAYLRDRYGEAPLARYGILASSKDKFLPRFGVDNTFHTTKRLRVGLWYNADPSDPRSCCQLKDVATEFASQGLELDFGLVAWGSDFRRVNGQWSDDLSGKYRDKVRDRLALRRNVYRVMLTRGRDGCVVFVPALSELDETWQYLRDAGFGLLT
jgi:hypothetical protein